MRIGFDPGSIVGKHGEVGWLTHHVVRALVTLKEGIEFVACVKPGWLVSGWPVGW